MSGLEFTLCLWVPDTLYSHTISHLDFSTLLKFFTEFFLCCLYDIPWPFSQIKQMLVSHLFLDMPFIQLEVNWLPCDFCNPMCSRKVNL